MKLDEAEKGTVVEINGSRYSVVGHGPMGSRVQKLVQLKSGWGKRNVIMLSSQTECRVLPN